MLVYDANTFKKEKELNWNYEGWGITHFNNQLIISTGSSNLYFVNPATLAIEKTLGVYDNNGYIDDIHGWDAFYEDGTPEDGDGHGSHVSGIIGAVGNNGVGVTGINQVASIINVRIFNEDGYTTDAAILGGYDYISALLDNGVSIAAVNQSWGGGIDYGDPELANIVSMFYFYASYHGLYNTVWVVSAGNSSLDHDNLLYQRFPDPIQAPNIISVASTDANDGLSGFSDYGKHTVEIGSPGTDILSTVVGGWEFYSGTSMASPYVTGAIALAANLYPETICLVLFVPN